MHNEFNAIIEKDNDWFYLFSNLRNLRNSLFNKGAKVGE